MDTFIGGIIRRIMIVANVITCWMTTLTLGELSTGNSYCKDSTMQLLMLAVLVTKDVIVHWDQLLPSYSYACSQTRDQDIHM